MRRNKNKPELEEKGVLVWHDIAEANVLVGTHVILSYEGAERWGDDERQGNGAQGVITDTINDELPGWVTVRWDNGRVNQYRSGDLVRVLTEPKTPVIKQATFWDCGL